MIMNKPDLYTLLKQFNAIGGIAQTGQSGFCLLMALWQKSNELNWAKQFTMTNAELLYKAGFNTEKHLIEVKNKLSQLGYYQYIKPTNRRKAGTFILNFNLYNLVNYLPQVNSEVSNSVSSEVNSEVNSAVSSSVNINKLNTTTKLNNNYLVGVVEEETATTEQEGLREIVDYFNNNIYVMSPIELKKFTEWHNSIDADAIIFAIEEAVLQGKRTMAYIEGILKNYMAMGVKTRADAETLKREWQDKKNKKAEAKAANKNVNQKKNSFNNFRGRQDDDPDYAKKIEEGLRRKMQQIQKSNAL